MKSTSCIIAGIWAFVSSNGKKTLESRMKEEKIFSEVIEYIKTSVLWEFGVRNKPQQINGIFAIIYGEPSIINF